MFGSCYKHYCTLMVTSRKNDPFDLAMLNQGSFCHVNLLCHSRKLWMSQCEVIDVQHAVNFFWHLVQSVQCMNYEVYRCSFWCIAGAGTVPNVHCAVGRVQCAACQKWKYNMPSKLLLKNKQPRFMFVIVLTMFIMKIMINLFILFKMFIIFIILQCY